MINLIIVTPLKVSYYTKENDQKQDKNQLPQRPHLKSGHIPETQNHKQIQDYRKIKFKDSMKIFCRKQWGQNHKFHQ